jgi:hypothetical protein
MDPQALLDTLRLKRSLRLPESEGYDLAESAQMHPKTQNSPHRNDAKNFSPQLRNIELLCRRFY